MGLTDQLVSLFRVDPYFKSTGRPVSGGFYPLITSYKRWSQLSASKIFCATVRVSYSEHQSDWKHFTCFFSRQSTTANCSLRERERCSLLENHYWTIILQQWVKCSCFDPTALAHRPNEVLNIINDTNIVRKSLADLAQKSWQCTWIALSLQE